jgi:hypothetical protein
MTRYRTLLPFALLFLLACSTARPAATPPPVDPVTDPTIVGAIDEAAREGSIQGEAAARTGRRVGRVAGVLAAVLGGPEEESLDDIVDRYRRTRDAAEATATAIGVTQGVVEGAQRGYELDLQFAELVAIEELAVLRPRPDEIDVYFETVPDAGLLARIAAVLANREERAIEIEAAEQDANGIRESLIQLGVSPFSLSTYRNDGAKDIVMRIRYQS